jgi:hypothetical protein
MSVRKRIQFWKDALNLGEHHLVSIQDHVATGAKVLAAIVLVGGISFATNTVGFGAGVFLIVVVAIVVLEGAYLAWAEIEAKLPDPTSPKLIPSNHAELIAAISLLSTRSHDLLFQHEWFKLFRQTGDAFAELDTARTSYRNAWDALEIEERIAGFQFRGIASFKAVVGDAAGWAWFTAKEPDWDASQYYQARMLVSDATYRICREIHDGTATKLWREFVDGSEERAIYLKGGLSNVGGFGVEKAT